MASSRPWRWLVLLTSGGLFGLAVVAAQASGSDPGADSTVVEAIETPVPKRSDPVIPDAAPMPVPDTSADAAEESFHTRARTRAKRPTNRTNKRNASKDAYRFSASKSGILPSRMFEADDSVGLGTVQSQANPAPR